MIPLDRIALVDFEASSLSRTSYPIEVGWCLADTGRLGSRLIRPADGWTDWDIAAQAVHGISKAELIAAGLPPAEVATEFLTMTLGRTLYADSSADQRWINRLFEAASVSAPVILPFDELLDSIVRPEPQGRSGEWLADELRKAELQGALIDAAFNAARSSAPKTHRAGPDAYHLYVVLLHVLARAAR